MARWARRGSPLLSPLAALTYAASGAAAMLGLPATANVIADRSQARSRSHRMTNIEICHFNLVR